MVAGAQIADELTVSQLICRLARDQGEAVAIADAEGAVSFRELEEGSRRIAAGLLATGTAKGSKIGLLMGNDRHWLEAFLAITRIGAVAVLLSTLARGPELAHMIRNGDVDVLLMADAYLSSDYCALLEDGLPGLARGSGEDARLLCAEAPFLRAVWVWGEQQPGWCRGGPDELVAAGRAIPDNVVEAALDQTVGADPAAILYTSGSTAEPKAVVHSQANLVRQGHALGKLSSCRPGDLVLSSMPFFWVGGLSTVLMTAFTQGAGVVCTQGPSEAAVMEAIRRWKPSQILHWPAVLDKLMDTPEFVAALADMRPMFSQQLYMFGLATRAQSAFALGMTETLGPHSYATLEPVPDDRLGSNGTAVGTYERRIVDPETGKDCAPGEVGALWLRGGSLMLGFHRKERSDVFDADGWYHTDDLCRIMEDGHLFFVGRSNDMVKTSGANVSPDEVEKAMRDHPALKEVSVLGLPGEEADELLVAAVVLRKGHEVGEKDLQGWLRQKLSSYKVPRRIVFLNDGEIPLTAGQKVYKHGLRALLADRLGKA